MAIPRDPLSVRYDAAVGRLLRLAEGTGPPRLVRGFVASPAQEFRRVDRGGRTQHERAFTRSAYYQVRRVPINAGELPVWSLKLTWGPIERRGGRWGREIRLRLFRYGSGQRHSERRPGSRYLDRDELKARPGMVGG